APLAGGFGPADEGGVGAFDHLLLLLVLDFLGRFLPVEVQVPSGRNEPQADRSTGGKEERAAIAVIIFGAEVLLDGGVGEVAGGDHMGGHRAAEAFAGAAGLGKVNFDEAAVLAGK